MGAHPGRGGVKRSASLLARLWSSRSYSQKSAASDGDLSEARDTLEEGLATLEAAGAPHIGTLLKYRSDLLFADHRYDEGLEMAVRATETSPRDWWLWANLCDRRVARADLSGCVAALEAGLSAGASEWALHHELGEHFLRVRPDFDRARAHFMQAYEASGHGPFLFDRLASLDAASGDYGSAISLLLRADRVEHTSERTLKISRLYRRDLDDPVQAKAVIERAVAHHPTEQDLQAALAGFDEADAHRVSHPVVEVGIDGFSDLDATRTSLLHLLIDRDPSSESLLELALEFLVETPHRLAFLGEDDRAQRLMTQLRMAFPSSPAVSATMVGLYGWRAPEGARAIAEGAGRARDLLLAELSIDAGDPAGARSAIARAEVWSGRHLSFLFDEDTRTPEAHTIVHNVGGAILVSADAAWSTTGPDAGVSLVDLQTGRVARWLELGGGDPIALSPDGSTLVVRYDGYIALFDTHDGRRITTLRFTGLPAWHGSQVADRLGEGHEDRGDPPRRSADPPGHVGLRCDRHSRQRLGADRGGAWAALVSGASVAQLYQPTIERGRWSRCSGVLRTAPRAASVRRSGSGTARCPTGPSPGRWFAAARSRA